MRISDNLKTVQNSILKEVTLVVVSKTKSNADILQAYNNGQRIFGENKVKELVAKAATLPQDICWHMIGHLQTNILKNLLI